MVNSSGQGDRSAYMQFCFQTAERLRSAREPHGTQNRNSRPAVKSATRLRAAEPVRTQYKQEKEKLRQDSGTDSIVWMREENKAFSALLAYFALSAVMHPGLFYSRRLPDGCACAAIRQTAAGAKCS